jgi:hypothetical protein
VGHGVGVPGTGQHVVDPAPMLGLSHDLLDLAPGVRVVDCPGLREGRDRAERMLVAGRKRAALLDPRGGQSEGPIMPLGARTMMVASSSS